MQPITPYGGAGPKNRDGIHTECRNPDHLKEPMRRLWADPPLTHMRRTTTEDVDFRGKLLRRGERVVVWYCSGNRDESVYELADAFRIDRADAHRHASYGFGIHHCLGRHVAALELRVLREEMLKRFERFEVTAPPERIRSNFSANYAHLMVRIPR
jgi:cytochrome P450